LCLLFFSTMTTFSWNQSFFRMSKWTYLEPCLTKFWANRDEKRIFSREKDKHNKRGYTVESVERFWKVYQTMPDHERAWYEVLVGGEACHLYFDIDFKKATRSELSDDEVPLLVHRFRALVGNAMLKDFGVKTRSFVNSAHGEKKFSWHLIYAADNETFFANNKDAKTYITQRLLPLMEEDTRLRLLVPFVDLSPYGDNQNFRLVWSTKFGEGRFLMPEEGTDIKSAKIGMFYTYLIAAGPIREGRTRRYMAWRGGGGPRGSLLFGEKQKMDELLAKPLHPRLADGGPRGVITLSCDSTEKRSGKRGWNDGRGGSKHGYGGPLYDDAGFRLRSYVKRIAPCRVEVQISSLRKYVCDGKGMPYAICPVHTVVCLVHGRKHKVNKRPQYVSVDLGSRKVSFRCQVRKKEGWRSICDVPCPRYVSDGFAKLGWAP